MVEVPLAEYKKFEGPYMYDEEERNATDNGK